MRNIKVISVLFRRLFCFYKKNFFVMGITIIISFLLICFITTAIGNLIMSTETSNANRYGIHHAIAYNVTSEQADSIEHKDNIETLGSITNYGQFNIKNQKINLSIGTFDENAFQLAHFKLIEGNYPTFDNEIVIEKNIARRIANFALGTEIILVNGENQHKFTVSGVIEDYSGQWNVPEEIVRGVNDLPSGIISNNKLISRQEIATDYLFQYRNYNADYIFVDFQNLGLDGYNSMVNSNYYEMGAMGINRLKLFNNIFFISILFIMSIIFCCIHSVILEKAMDSYRIIRIIGAQHKTIYLSYFFQLLMIFIPCSIIGALVGILFSKFFFAINISIFSLLSDISIWVRFILLSVVFFFISIFAYKKRFVDTHRQSLSHKSTINYPQKNLSVKGNFLSALANHNFSIYVSKQIPVVISLCIIILLSSLVHIYLSNMYSNDTTGLPSFILRPNQVEAYKELGTYRLPRSENRSIALSDTDGITSIQNIVWLADIETNCASIIFEDAESTTYWRQFNDSLSPESSSGSLPIYGSVCNNYRILLMNDNLISYINQNYTDALQGRQISNQNTILFLPNYSGINISQLEFASLNIDRQKTDFFSAIEDTSLIDFHTESLPIDININREFQFETNGAAIQENIPTILIPKEKISNSTIFNGVKAITIYVSPIIKEDGMEVLNDELRTFIYQYPDAQFFSLFEELQREEDNRKVINITSFSLTTTLIVFTLTTFYSLIYLSILAREKSLAICRVMGLDPLEISKLIFIEIKRYIILFVALALIEILLLNLILKVPLDMNILILLQLLFLSTVFLISGVIIAKKFSNFFDEGKLIFFIDASEDM